MIFDRVGMGITNGRQRSQNMQCAEPRRTSPSSNLNISRERSNSHPGCRGSTTAMNGGNNYPTTEVGSATQVSGANSSPGTPLARRSKLAISIRRLFRPWKWRRRKKSQKFIATSQSKEPSFSLFCVVSRSDRN